ncbi:hypothetical protein B8B87_05720 [Streptococcus pyogenes]|nr:hypothetical protein AWT96_05430 [Streptococcus pyogenes]OYO25626.1 hypothetical protein B8B87_05720 [Streptococcus pyogenes]
MIKGLANLAKGCIINVIDLKMILLEKFIIHLKGAHYFSYRLADHAFFKFFWLVQPLGWDHCLKESSLELTLLRRCTK